MTWIKLRNTFAEDDRWLDAGPVACAVHIAALCYSDQHLTDGAIRASRVRRVALTLGVPPDDAEEAARKLVGAGFWEPTEEGYQIVGYLDDQISKADTERTRTRWAADQRKRRQHNAGDHALCDPARCSARRAVSSNASDEEEKPSSKDKAIVRRGERDSPTRKSPVSRPLDPTRPDPTKGKGREGRGKGGSAKRVPPPRSARRHAPAAPPPRPTPTREAEQRFTPPSSGPPCPHGIPGGLMNSASGEFMCQRCEAVAADPAELQAWVTPEVRAYVEHEPIKCRDSASTLVAQAVAQRAAKRHSLDRGSTNQVFRHNAVMIRLLQAYAVERLEPGRVAEVVAAASEQEPSE